MVILNAWLGSYSSACEPQRRQWIAINHLISENIIRSLWRHLLGRIFRFNLYPQMIWLWLWLDDRPNINFDSFLLRLMNRGSLAERKNRLEWRLNGWFDPNMVMDTISIFIVWIFVLKINWLICYFQLKYRIWLHTLPANASCRPLNRNSSIYSFTMNLNSQQLNDSNCLISFHKISRTIGIRKPPFLLNYTQKHWK